MERKICNLSAYWALRVLSGSNEENVGSMSKRRIFSSGRITETGANYGRGDFSYSCQDIKRGCQQKKGTRRAAKIAQGKKKISWLEGAANVWPEEKDNGKKTKEFKKDSRKRVFGQPNGSGLGVGGGGGETFWGAARTTSYSGGSHYRTEKKKKSSEIRGAIFLVECPKACKRFRKGENYQRIWDKAAEMATGGQPCLVGGKQK